MNLTSEDEHFEPSLFVVDENEASSRLLENYLLQVFSKPRNEQKLQLKEGARSIIIKMMRKFNLNVHLQVFYAKSSNLTEVRGVNVIGIKPGRNRGTNMDKILVIGAHYDTVALTPGVDDNGSGVTALLEAARLITKRTDELNCTIMFVAFDLEEKGILGSLAFVNYYLIPKELMNKKTQFIGAFVLDMVLNYDTSPGSQVLPYDISRVK